MRTGHCESASHPTYPAAPRRLCASGRRDHCRTARASGMAVGEATRRCRGTVCGRVIRQQMGRWRDDGRFDPRERHRLPGIHTRGDRIEEDEIGIVNNVPTTTPARTVLDLGCWYPTTSAVAAIDSLARAVEVKAADVELLAQRYPGRRGITRARRALALFDAGAQSPKETWLRLLLVEAGLPRPQTQIPVCDEFGSAIAYLDMDWEDLKVAVEYDGEQHRNDRRQYTWDVRRLERLDQLGWIVVRVVAGDRPAEIIRRVRAARARRA